MKTYSCTEFDRMIWEEELSGFVPQKIFDAHAHIWNDRFALPETAESPFRITAGLAEMRAHTEQLFPGRESHFFMLGTPLPVFDFEGDHVWAAAEAEKDNGNSATAILVTPQMSPDKLADFVKKTNVRGFKPYRLYAADPANCDITDYLPEAQIEVANHYKMIVVLHLSKPDGAANERNQKQLADFDKRYPNVTWQLAHCARAFNPFTLEKSIHFYKELEHICYDSSAVCDLYSHYLLMKHDRKRMMFGTDNIVAGSDHGKYITWGKAWEFFPGMDREFCDSRSTFVVYEQLRCQKRAADILNLSSTEIEDLFYNNAQRIIFNK